MAAKIMDGKKLAIERRYHKLRDLRGQAGKKPCLAIITVSMCSNKIDTAGDVYVRSKQQACAQLNIDCIVIKKSYLYEEIKGKVAQYDLASTIAILNEKNSITAIMVQLPLPVGLDSREVLNCISPSKDVDGLTDVNMGSLVTHWGYRGITPCTPKGIMELLFNEGIELKGKEAVVVGRSNIVGKPLVALLLQEDCTVTICHSYTENLAQHTRNADILIVAVGKAGFITKDMVKPGAVVIDVGINRVDGKIVGDVSPDVDEVAGYMTPVPGGVGPMTVSCLMENVLNIAIKNKQEKVRNL